MVIVLYRLLVVMGHTLYYTIYRYMLLLYIHTVTYICHGTPNVYLLNCWMMLYWNHCVCRFLTFKGYTYIYLWYQKSEQLYWHSEKILLIVYLETKKHALFVCGRMKPKISAQGKQRIMIGCPVGKIFCSQTQSHMDHNP